MEITKRGSKNFTDLRWTQNDASDYGFDRCGSDLWVSFNEYQSRSESCSSSTWTNDEEYEREVGEKVGLMLEHVDCRLYEETELPDCCKNLEDECKIWVKAHPHLRLIGKSYSNCTDPEVESLALINFGLDNAIPKNTSDFGAEYELIPGLEILGTKLNLNSSSKKFSEEHIAIDGTFEELLAYDNQDGLWSDNQRDADNESELKKRIKEKLSQIIWQKVVAKLFQDLAYRWENTDINKLSQLPMLPTNRKKTGPNVQSPKKLSEAGKDLQSLLTISSKTLLNRNTRPPSVRTGARTSISSSTVNLRLGSPQRVGTASLPPFTRRLAPIDLVHQLSNNNNIPIMLEDQLNSPINIINHFPALPPIEKVTVLSANLKNRVRPSSPGSIVRTLSESKSTERTSLRLNSGSRLPIHISKITLGSNQLKTIIDYPRSANWIDRANSNKLTNLDNSTSLQLNSDFPATRTSSAVRKYDKAESESNKTKWN